MIDFSSQVSAEIADSAPLASKAELVVWIAGGIIILVGWPEIFDWTRLVIRIMAWTVVSSQISTELLAKLEAQRKLLLDLGGRNKLINFKHSGPTSRSKLISE